MGTLIPLNQPSLGHLELRAALTPGAARVRFEAEVAARAGARFGLAFAYAHSGFYALLRSLNLTGCEIILPAYTCQIMPAVVLATGNVPVLIDIDRDGPNVDPRALRSAITPRTRCIVATHMLGYPTSVRAIREVAGDERIAILEDAAMMFPGSTVGREGLQGDAALFSFGPAKPLFTLRGGVVVTNRADLHANLAAFREREMSALPPIELAKRWALLLSYGALARSPTEALFGRLRPLKDRLRKSAKRDSRTNPSGASNATLPNDYSTALTDFQARIGLAQLARSDAIRARRVAQAGLYAELLDGIPGLEPSPIVEGASYSPYTVRVKGQDTVLLRERMLSRGVEVGHTRSYDLPGTARYRPYCQGDCPNTRESSREVLRLPASFGLTERQSQLIAETIRRVLGGQASLDRRDAIGEGSVA